MLKVCDDLNYDDIVETAPADDRVQNDLEEIEGVLLEYEASFLGRSEFVIASIHGWPEVKTTFENKCVKIFGKRICTKVPVVYHRTSHLEVIAQVDHPEIDAIKADLEDCVRQAAAAGVAAGALSGNIAAALAAFEAYLKTCLTAKGTKRLGELKVGLHTKKTPGPWH